MPAEVGRWPTGANSAFDFYFDEPANQLSPDQANFAPKAGTGLQRTCKVGTYKPNRLGLYDMHGNVWQWCAWEPPAEPKDAKAALLRVVRGGSCVAGWDGTACCRAAFRLPPVGVSHRDRDVGLHWPGFLSARRASRTRQRQGRRSAARRYPPHCGSREDGRLRRHRHGPLGADPDRSRREHCESGRVFKDGVLELRDGMAIDKSVQAKDMIMRAKVRKLAGRNVAFLYAQNPPDRMNGSRYSALCFGTDRRLVGVGKTNDKQWTNLPCQVYEPIAVKDGELFEFAFAVVGDTLTVYMNGKRILVARDPTPCRAPRPGPCCPVVPGPVQGH